MKRFFQLPVLSLGFRPFFLLGPFYAIIFLGYWSGYQMGLARLPAYFSPTAFHAHEMMFGFIAAIIAGFLLTASKNWTNTRGVHGASLSLLVLVWILGRLVMLAPDRFPSPLCAIVDLAFLPLLIGFLAVTLFKGKRSNLFVLVWVAFLFLGNLLMHLDAQEIVPDMARRGYLLAVDAVIVLMVFLGGRVIPLFTRNAIPSAGVGSVRKCVSEPPSQCDRQKDIGYEVPSGNYQS